MQLVIFFFFFFSPSALVAVTVEQFSSSHYSMDGFLSRCSVAPAAKRRRPTESSSSPANSNQFDSLPDDLLHLILDHLPDPIDKKSFSVVCRRFLAVESLHRRKITPLRLPLLAAALARYPQASAIDFSLLPRITDAALSASAAAVGRTLRSVDLSRSRGFSHAGISAVVASSSLVELNLSNATELDDRAAAAVGEARNLRRLWLARCKSVTDMGIGCIAVGCPKLRFICLKWCIGISDLGIGLVAIKCRELTSLDLSYMQVKFGFFRCGFSVLF